jgi:hypothetical protein
MPVSSVPLLETHIAGRPRECAADPVFAARVGRFRPSHMRTIFWWRRRAQLSLSTNRAAFKTSLAKATPHF